MSPTEMPSDLSMGTARVPGIAPGGTAATTMLPDEEVEGGLGLSAGALGLLSLLSALLPMPNQFEIRDPIPSEGALLESSATAGRHRHWR